MENNYKSIVLLFLLIVSCKNFDDKGKEVSFIDSIDQISGINTIYEFKTDSIGNVLDTLSVEKYKVDKKGKKVFKETKMIRGSGFLKKTEYYKDDDVFYSKSESSDLGVLSVFEFLNESKQLERAISVEYRDNKPYDTVFMDYKYKYRNGVLSEMNVSGRLSNDYQSKTLITYNKEEEPIEEISILNKDTLSLVKYEYTNHVISKKKINDYKSNAQVIFNYDDKGDVLLQEVFVENNDSLEKVNQIIYEANLKGEILRTVQTQYPSKLKQYTVFNYNR